MRLWRLGAALLVATGLVRGLPAIAADPPPGAGATGTVSGVVLDKTTVDPIIEAGVEIVGQGKIVKTDLDGRFRVELPPGTYQLRIFAPLYQPLRLQNVVVTAGNVTKADASLATAKGSVEVVEVVAQADRAAEATQLAERKKAAVVSDTLSAEVIKKTPDRDAAAVVKRVPAVTVKDDRFIFIRGLGERYSSALLNGSRLPSPDPERRVVPLDLFPADFIESLAVIKSYTPDLPGDFSGGLVDIHTREFPDRFTLSAGMSTAFNSQTTFKNFRTYKGGSLDYLGLGDEFRELPAIPDTTSFKTLSPLRKDLFAQQFKNIWNTRLHDAPPDSGVNLALGDSLGPLGVELAGVYTTQYQSIPHRLENTFTNTGGTNAKIGLDTTLRVDDSIFKTRLGGLLTSSYRLGANHKLFFRGLVDHNSFDVVTATDGRDTQNQLLRQTVLRYTEEELDFGQLGGEHRWSHLWLDWRTAYSRTTQKEPDTRYIAYEAANPPGQPHGPFQFSTDSSGGTRVFNGLTETLTDSAVDFTIPFSTGLPFTDIWSGLPAKFKFGPAYSYRERTFDQRRFTYTPNLGAFDLTQSPEVILAPSNLIPGLVDFDETTQAGDSYSVTQEIIGGYGMLDLPLVRDRLRLVAGVRQEYSYIRLKTFAIGATGLQQIVKNDLDPLPGANLVFSPRYDMNLRFGYSRSVSRPEFRELSPTQFPSPRGLRPIIGNPNLVESHIENWDLRWEWFFSPLELVSLSGFRKNLQRPIEQTVVPESSFNVDSFTNATSGKLTGFEFEGRKDLGFVRPWLKNLSLAANVAYIDSTVTIPGGKLQVQTSKQRPLSGQAPYIANAVLEWADPRWGSYRLLYYTAGPRVAEIGADFLPDIVEESRNQLDAVAVVPVTLLDLPLTVKLAVENILNDPVRFTQGGLPQREFRLGRKVSIGLAYTY